MLPRAHSEPGVLVGDLGSEILAGVAALVAALLAGGFIASSRKKRRRDAQAPPTPPSAAVVVESARDTLDELLERDKSEVQAAAESDNPEDELADLVNTRRGRR